MLNYLDLYGFSVIWACIELLIMVELASIVILGIFSQWLAWRLKVPAILPLILVGLLVGPFSTMWTHDGHKWLEPIYDAAKGKGIFPGSYLFSFVELSIGVILFEGGLTLKRSEIQSIGPIIGKLISLGSAVTFFGAAIITHYLIGIDWPLSFLFSGLIIVTGPTVIAPILRNIPLKRNVANILKWEGILIDPIGALVAVLMYEFIVSTADDGNHFTQEAIKHFATLAAMGFALGTAAAFILQQILKRHWVPHYLLNIFTLAFVLLVFVTSGTLVHDSGLLTIVVMGTIMANIEVPNIEEIYYFKESLAVLLISMLFILLAANINIADLQLLLDWKIAMLFLAVILVIRPLGVFLSSFNNDSISTNEKMFISWVGPRGIVAAGIASLFGTRLVQQGYAGAEYITPLVFMIVLGTVLLNATTAGLIAKWLGVLLEKSNGVLIVGATKASRILAKYIHDGGNDVVIVDNNKSNIERSKALGLTAIQANIYGDDLKDNIELNNVGVLLAMTSSTDVNKYALNKFSDNFGEHGAYRLVSSDEIKNMELIEEECVFSKSDDFLNLNEVARDYPDLREVKIESKDHFIELMKQINGEQNRIPLLLKDSQNGIRFVPAKDFQDAALNADTILVYMGIPIEQKPTEEEVAE